MLGGLKINALKMYENPRAASSRSTVQLKLYFRKSPAIMDFVTRIFRSVSLKSLQQLYFIICDVLRDLVAFVQFQKSEKHP